MKVILQKVISESDSERYFYWSNHEGSRCFKPNLIHELSILLANEFKDRIEELYTVEECKLTGNIVISCDLTLVSADELKAIYRHEKGILMEFEINPKDYSEIGKNRFDLIDEKIEEISTLIKEISSFHNENMLSLVFEVKKTLEENMHLTDGDLCTLKDLRDAYLRIDPDWGKEQGE